MRARRRKLRLYTLGVLFALITLTIWVRLVQVQIFSHNHYKNTARKQWARTREIPPVRGAILDRNHRPLALSSRSYSISLNPEQARNNAGAVTSSVARIARVSEAGVKKKLRSNSKFVYIRRKFNLTENEVRELNSLPGVGLHSEADRTYPFGTVANKLVGFFGYDDKGMAGIEAAFDAQLSGKPGFEKILLDGKYRAHGYSKYPKQSPVNGHTVILTIDTAIQEIAEVELARAVKKTNARWGTVLVMDCRTGEILALAEDPAPRSRAFSSMVDSLWTIRSVSCVYEPGSTFKLVTAATLLESGAVKPSDIFFAENGRADLGFARISDAHPFGYLTFRESFVQSSNIVMAKAIQKISDQEFYKFVRLFGFGSKTGVELMGESPGQVAPVESWSKRTQATMSFGQEIAVTPLQILNSFAAVANDGVLMEPKIVKAIVDEHGTVVSNSEPEKIRSVISKQTALTLKSFCRDVVEEGTGISAKIGWLEASGKTGTGQKASPRGGYQPGKFSASFIGFIPYQDPKIACLVLLDEPDWAYRFGGVSAAPVFAEISRAIATSTELFNDALVTRTIAASTGNEAEQTTPNFLRMEVSAAMTKAREHNLVTLCSAEQGQIISQDPDPDVPIDKDTIVRLFVSGEETKAAGTIPDLTGLSLREAKRRIVEIGCEPVIRGSGVVISQFPRAGERSSSGVVQLRCKQ
jgi:stage V sporulation protein D (sporulation-specific penicillin-binding protein)